ncbi:MAG: amino acid-binding protein [Eggerthellaceae bacterium]
MIEQLTVLLENEKGCTFTLCRILRTQTSTCTTSLSPIRRTSASFASSAIPRNAPRVLGGGLSRPRRRGLAVRVPNVAGGLASLLEAIDECGSNVEYGYCFSRGEETAIDVLKVADASIEATLSEKGFDIVKAEEVYALDE